MNGYNFIQRNPDGNPMMQYIGPLSDYQYVWPVYREHHENFVADYYQLRLFVKDVLFYVCAKDEKLNVLSRTVISLRRKMDPEGMYFTEDIGILTKNLVMLLRHKDWDKFDSNILDWKYTRAMLQSEQSCSLTKYKWWMVYRVRKHYMCLYTERLCDFFMYLAYLSKYCTTLLLEGTPYNEIECITIMGAEMIFGSLHAFPNYELLNNFAKLKKFILSNELLLEAC